MTKNQLAIEIQKQASSSSRIQSVSNYSTNLFRFAEVAFREMLSDADESLARDPELRKKAIKLCASIAEEMVLELVDRVTELIDDISAIDKLVAAPKTAVGQ